jgi:hypothetical protein
MADFLTVCANMLIQATEIIRKDDGGAALVDCAAPWRSPRQDSPQSKPEEA